MKPIILPEEKLDELAQKVSAALISGHYFNNEVIRGDEIKNFAEHQQINKFLLFQIYQVWNIQISKLKHPYFDFSHPEVEQELTSLRNLLSQHIRINQSDFEPLLKRAVYNNLKLLLDPVASFEDFFFLDKDTIDLELFSQYTPFFKDMDFVVNSIMKYHQKHAIDTVEKSTFFSKMEKVISLYDQKSPAGFEEYRKDVLSKILQRNIEDVIAEVEHELRAAQQVEEFTPSVSDSLREDQRNHQEEDEAQNDTPAPEPQHNFFETVIADNTSIPFDFSDDIDELDSVEIPQEQPVQQRPAASWNNVQSEQDNNYFNTSPTEEKSDTRYADYEPYQTETQRETSYTDSEERESSSQPKTVEEALSSFLNTESKSRPQTNFDTFNQTRPQTPPERTYDQFRPQPPENRSVEQSKPYTPPERPYEPQPKEQPGRTEDRSFNDPLSFPEKEVPTPKAPETKESTGGGHINRFLNEEKEELTSDVATNYSRILTNHKNERTPTIAEKLQTQQTKQNANGGKEIKLSDIPIHRQYQFVQKVFEGNNVRFRIIVDKVNNSKNGDEVEGIIDRFVLSNETINSNDEVVQDFIQLLRNRH